MVSKFILQVKKNEICIERKEKNKVELKILMGFLLPFAMQFC